MKSCNPPGLQEINVTCSCGNSFKTARRSARTCRSKSARLPPVLHGQAEDGRHRRPRRQVPQEVRRRGDRRRVWLASRRGRCGAPLSFAELSRPSSAGLWTEVAAGNLAAEGSTYCCSPPPWLRHSSPLAARPTRVTGKSDIGDDVRAVQESRDLAQVHPTDHPGLRRLRRPGPAGLRQRPSASASRAQRPARPAVHVHRARRRRVNAFTTGGATSTCTAACWRT